MLSIKSDFRAVQAMLDQLPGKVQAQVIPAALNKTADKAKTEMVRQITSEFNLSAAEVRGRLKIKRASRKLGIFEVVLDPFAGSRKGRSMNLIRFVEKSVSLAEARRRKKGGTLSQLRFQIKKQAGKKTIQGAFIATNRKTGGTAVFQRVGDGKAIKPVQTIDVPSMFNTKRINAAVIEKIRRELGVEFERAIKAAMAGALR